MAKVQIFMGSESDRMLANEIRDMFITHQFDDFQIDVISAHRNPQKLDTAIKEATIGYCQVFICIAGLAAHLAGAVAARTVRPVIGVPAAGGSLNGLDALLSTVQMPAGVPVATVAIGKPGARNAAILALQILALTDEYILRRLEDAKEQ